MKVAGVCRLCASHTGYAMNPATLRVSDVLSCPHCDSVCHNALCKKCARMRQTVRIVPRTEEEPP